jgi:AraC-like DNA-binding protein
MATLLHIGRIEQPMHRSRPHRHEREELCLYLTGTGTAWIGARAVAFVPGTLIRFPPRIMHHEESARGTTLIWLGTDARVGEARDVHRLPAGGAVWRIVEVICALSAEGGRALPAQQRLFDAVEALLAAPAGEGPEEGLRLAIEAGHRDPEFNVARAMAGGGMSADHLRRRFAARFGLPPVRYLARARVESAKALLRRGGMSMAAVAGEVGLPDPYYFSRTFRAWAGVPPSRWRAEGEGR